MPSRSTNRTRTHLHIFKIYHSRSNPLVHPLDVSLTPLSTYVRSYEERSLLIAKANRGRMVTIQLKGYIFFGR